MDDLMKRSKSQVMYKYLPESYIDYYDKTTRTAYTARVKKWHSRRLENLNEKRLLIQVEKAVCSFNEVENVKGYDLEFTKERYDILEPVSTDKDPRIFVEIDPLTFYCEKCMKVYTQEHKYIKSNAKRPVSKCCKVTLKQIKLAYICKCGNAEGVKLKSCQNHGLTDIRYSNKFQYYCGVCKKSIEMIKTCDNCGTKMYTKNPLDQSVLIPHSIALVDLIDMKEEKILGKSDFGTEAIIAKYLDMISENEMENLIDYKEKKSDGQDEEREKKKNELIEMGIPLDKIEAIFKTMDPTDDLVKKVKNMITTSIKSESSLEKIEIATNILEYWKIKNESDAISFEAAIVIATDIKGPLTEVIYRKAVEKVGVRNIVLATNVPIINCTYGFTRKESEPQNGVVLRSFPPEIEKKNIYAMKIITEGILLEIDKLRIVSWMEKNNFINVKESPKTLSETDIWFLNNVECMAVPTFNNIDENDHYFTSKVYTLLHSISHILIKQASFFSGLDKNSLSEYIIPNTSSILIYCQNSQGYVLGALQNLFETCIDVWLESAFEEVSRCVFDPLCIDREHACFGCLYLNEISCRHFNKDLDRRMLIGYESIEKEESIIGFWEDIFYG